MFNDVRGQGIKRFFSGRKGRKLSFATDKPVKVQAGAQIMQIASGAVSKSTDGLIIASLKAKINDLEKQLAAGKNPDLEAKLAWAKEYLKKFEDAVAQIKRSPQSPVPTPTTKDPTPKTTPKKPSTNKEEHELKTLLSSIKLQGEKVRNSLLNMAFTIVKDDMDALTSEIETLDEQTKIYEKSVASYVSKTGKDDYYKIIIEERRLKTIYKSLAKKIEELTDLQVTNPTSYEIKQKKAMLEKMADNLRKYAASPEVYERLRTEADRELANSKKKRMAPADPVVETPTEPVVETPTEPVSAPIEQAVEPQVDHVVVPPQKPSYQDDVEAYIKELQRINAEIVELNKLIAQTEDITVDVVVTPEIIDTIIHLAEQIKTRSHKIDTDKIALSRKAKEIRDTHKIDVTKLTSVQAITVENVRYNMPYVLYIESLERKSLETIEDIKELALSKAHATKETVHGINENIAKLYQFLLAINALIDRRIVNYSRVNKKNVTSLYKERREKRKQLARDYEVGNVDYISAVPQELDVFKAKITELRTVWLEAFNKAPISLAGRIMIDESEYVTSMTELITSAHDNEKLQIISESSEAFNKARIQIVKEKQAALRKLERLIRARIEAIFRSDTISETVVPEVDYNEWLTLVEYNELKLLASDTEFKNLVPNAMDIVEECVTEQEKKYQDIKRRLKTDTIDKLHTETEVVLEVINGIPVDEHFEVNVRSLFETLKKRFKVLRDIQFEIDLATNLVQIKYKAIKYNFTTGAYHLEQEVLEHVIMSREKLEEYQQQRKIGPSPKNPAEDSAEVVSEVPVDVVPEVPAEVIPEVTEQPEKQDDELQRPAIVFEGENPQKVAVTNRTIQLATTRRQVINRAKSLVIENADSLTVSLIKQGLRIKYNEHLRDQLKSLNAKLSLVNKDNYRSRKSIRFDGEETEQDLAFKSHKENFDIADYKLEVRLVDDEKKKSDLLYTYDLESISEELHGRRK